MERRAWYWAFSQLAKPKPGLGITVGRLKLRIAETILYESNGEAVLWLFTSKDGDVMRRDRRRLKLETVVETMQRHGRRDALEAGSRPAQTYAVCVRKGNESAPEVKAVLLTEQELLEQGKEGGGLTGGLMALQVAVHPRGGGGTRYRCEAALGSDGITVKYTTTKLAYLGAPTDAEAPHPRSTAGASLGVGRAFAIKCTMNAFNDDLARRTASIIYHLQECGKTKMVKLQADYILSAASDEPTLVSLPLVLTTPLPKPPPHSTASLTSCASAASAAEAGGSGGGGGVSYATLPKVPTDPTVISMLVRSASVPAVPPDSGLAGKSPLTVSPPLLAGAKRGSKKAADAASAASASSLSRPSSRAALDAHARPAPWLRLHPPIAKGFVQDKRRPKAHVCLGDFCTVPVHAIQKNDEDEWARENVVEDDGPGSRKGFKRTGSARRRRHLEEEEKAPEEAPGAPPPGLPLYTVPYRSLLQARAERAVAAPDAGAAAKGANGSALRSALLLQGKPGRPHPMGPQLPKPAEFYDTVLVCHSCYVVYCRLDAARARTLSPHDERPRSPSRSIGSSSRAASPPLSPGKAVRSADDAMAGALQRSSTAPAGTQAVAALEQEAEAAEQRAAVAEQRAMAAEQRAAAAEYEAEQRSMPSSSGPSSGCNSGPSSVLSSGLRPNSAAAEEDPPLRRSATHAGTGSLVRSSSASALGRGLPGGASSALTRYGTSSLGVDLFGTGGIGFDKGRYGRRQLRAPARLAQLNREDEMGPRQVKRLLAELGRRPQSALPHPPAHALPSGKASAVAQALAGAMGSVDESQFRMPPRAYELTAMPAELAMMGAYGVDDPEYLAELAALGAAPAGTLSGTPSGTPSGAGTPGGGWEADGHVQMIMASRSAAGLSGVCTGSGGGSVPGSAGSRGSTGTKMSHGTARSNARGGAARSAGGAGASGADKDRGADKDPSLYELAGQQPGDLGTAFGTDKPPPPERPANSETMFAPRQTKTPPRSPPRSPPKSPPRSRPGTGSRVSFGAAPA